MAHRYFSSPLRQWASAVRKRADSGSLCRAVAMSSAPKAVAAPELAAPRLSEASYLSRMVSSAHALILHLRGSRRSTSLVMRVVPVHIRRADRLRELASDLPPQLTSVCPVCHIAASNADAAVMVQPHCPDRHPRSIAELPVLAHVTLLASCVSSKSKLRSFSMIKPPQLPPSLRRDHPYPTNPRLHRPT